MAARRAADGQRDAMPQDSAYIGVGEPMRPPAPSVCFKLANDITRIFAHGRSAPQPS